MDGKLSGHVVVQYFCRPLYLPFRSGPQNKFRPRILGASTSRFDERAEKSDPRSKTINQCVFLKVWRDVRRIPFSRSIIAEPLVPLDPNFHQNHDTNSDARETIRGSGSSDTGSGHETEHNIRMSSPVSSFY